MNNTVKQIVKLAITAAILIFILVKVDPKTLWANMKQISPAHFAAAAAMFYSAICILAIRWGILLRAKGVRVPFRRLFSYYMVAWFFNTILPAQVGGDVVRAIDLSKHTEHATDAWATIIIERILGLLALVFTASVSVLIGYWNVQDPELQRVKWGVLAFLAALLAGFFTLFNPWALRLAQSIFARITFYNIGKTINKIYDAFYGYKNHPGAILSVLLLSILLQSLNYLGYYALSRSLVQGVPLYHFFINVPIASVVTTIPISVGGTGVMEGALAWLFRAQIDQSVTLAFAFAFRGLMLSAALIGGAVYLVRKPEDRMPASEAAGPHV